MTARYPSPLLSSDKTYNKAICQPKARAGPRLERLKARLSINTHSTHTQPPLLITCHLVAGVRVGTGHWPDGEGTLQEHHAIYHLYLCWLLSIRQ